VLRLDVWRDLPRVLVLPDCARAERPLELADVRELPELPELLVVGRLLLARPVDPRELLAELERRPLALAFVVPPADDRLRPLPCFSFS
jgi:hypothetical protein